MGIYDMLMKEATVSASHKGLKQKMMSFMNEKLHKWKKPRCIAEGATALATNFIPIPGVGTFVSFVEGKVSNSLKGGYRKLKEAENINPEILKFQIKSVDINSIDRGRRKLEKSIRGFKEIDGGSGGMQKGGDCVVQRDVCDSV